MKGHRWVGFQQGEEQRADDEVVPHSALYCGVPIELTPARVEIVDKKFVIVNLGDTKRIALASSDLHRGHRMDNAFSVEGKGKLSKVKVGSICYMFYFDCRQIWLLASDFRPNKGWSIERALHPRAKVA